MSFTYLSHPQHCILPITNLKKNSASASAIYSFSMKVKLFPDTSGNPQVFIGDPFCARRWGFISTKHTQSLPNGTLQTRKYNVNMSQLTRDIGDAKDAPQEEVREGCLEEAVLTYTSKRNNP